MKRRFVETGIKSDAFEAEKRRHEAPQTKIFENKQQKGLFEVKFGD